MKIIPYDPDVPLMDYDGVRMVPIEPGVRALELRWPDKSGNDDHGREPGSSERKFSDREKGAVEQQLRDPSLVNATLRGEHALTKEQQDHVAVLDSIIAGSLPLIAPLTVYRATSITAFNGEGFASTQPSDGIKQGSIFTDKGYVSTTTDRKSANDPGYTHPDDRMILNITVPAGTKVFEPSSAGLSDKAAELAGWEKEVLLARGSSFVIDKVVSARELNVTLLPKKQAENLQGGGAEKNSAVPAVEQRWPNKDGEDDHGRGPGGSEKGDKDEVATEDVFAKAGEPPPDGAKDILSSVKPEAQWVQGSDLVPTQETLSRETLDKYAKGPSGKLPDVIDKGGKLLLVDGHHRVGAGIEKGQTLFQVNVYKAPAGAEKNSAVPAVEQRWPDKSGEDDHGRGPGSGEHEKFGEAAGTTVDKAGELDASDRAEALSQIYDRVAALEDSGKTESDPEHAALTNMHAALSDTKGIVSVGLKDGEVVAAASAHLSEDGRSAAIDHVGSVQPGAGTAVVEHLVQQIKGTGAEEINLLATDNAISKGFYEKLGFKDTGNSTYQMKLKK